MKKLVTFLLVTLLFLSGCGNHPPVPADPLQASSQATNSTTAPSVPKETIVETVPEVPAKEPLTAPESEPTETETVPVPQAETSTTTLQEPQYETETAPPDRYGRIYYPSSAGRNAYANAARAI